MLERITKAFTYYNECCPNQVIVFRCVDIYYLCSSYTNVFQCLDAAKCDIRAVNANIRMIQVSAFDECYDTLIQHNVFVKMISCKNNSGEYDIPDIDEIKQEKEDDY